ncbi:hypothetical protein GCM10023174_02600 [Chelativorans composti]
MRVEDTWYAMGMRGTGSHDVIMDGLFIADGAVVFSRKGGEWHPVFQIISTIAFPLIYAVYLGIAERARDLAIEMAQGKSSSPVALDPAGRMETALRAAQLAHRWMVETAELNNPSAATVNEVMIGRSLVAKNAIRTVELALELVGGAGFYRRNVIERLFRDVQGARFHPLQAGPQARYAGAMAFGQDVSRIF